MSESPHHTSITTEQSNASARNPSMTMGLLIVDTSPRGQLATMEVPLPVLHRFIKTLAGTFGAGPATMSFHGGSAQEVTSQPGGVTLPGSLSGANGMRTAGIPGLELLIIRRPVLPKGATIITSIMRMRTPGAHATSQTGMIPLFDPLTEHDQIATSLVYHAVHIAGDRSRDVPQHHATRYRDDEAARECPHDTDANRRSTVPAPHEDQRRSRTGGP